MSPQRKPVTPEEFEDLIYDAVARGADRAQFVAWAKQHFEVRKEDEAA